MSQFVKHDPAHGAECQIGDQTGLGREGRVDIGRLQTLRPRLILHNQAPRVVDIFAKPQICPKAAHIDRPGVPQLWMVGKPGPGVAHMEGRVRETPDPGEAGGGHVHMAILDDGREVGGKVASSHLDRRITEHLSGEIVRAPRSDREGRRRGHARQTLGRH